MPLGVTHPPRGDPIDVGRVDGPAIAPHRGEANVVEHDVNGTRRTIRRPRWLKRRPVGLGIPNVNVDYSAERRAHANLDFPSNVGRFGPARPKSHARRARASPGPGDPIVSQQPTPRPLAARGGRPAGPMRCADGGSSCSGDDAADTCADDHVEVDADTRARRGRTTAPSSSKRPGQRHETTLAADPNHPRGETSMTVDAPSRALEPPASTRAAGRPL